MTQFFGLNDLDARLRPYLVRRRGTFVELGAFDGLDQSNTAWFEANRGWRGILIEPIPELFERCVRNRPLATVVNCACVSSTYDRSTVEMIYSGLMSIVRGARSSDQADEDWTALGEELQQLERYSCTVPARTLSSVLEDHGLQNIDLLSLDVEGYELEVLQGLDFERFRPHHVLVEESGSDGAASFLTAHGWNQVAELARGTETRDLLYERPLNSARRLVSRLPRLRRRSRRADVLSVHRSSCAAPGSSPHSRQHFLPTLRATILPPDERMREGPELQLIHP
jgi:FkbM family methyltransferase